MKIVLIVAGFVLAVILSVFMAFLSLCVLFMFRSVTLPDIKDVEPESCRHYCDDCEHE